MKMTGVALVIGASRGIGRQVAVDLAKNGYSGMLILSKHEVNIQCLTGPGHQVVVAAKSTSDAAAVKPFPPNPNSPQSTINTVVREILEAGGDATAIPVDVRDYKSVQRLLDESVKVGGFWDRVMENANLRIEIRPFRRLDIQFWCGMVGLYREDTNETIPAHAAGQSRGLV
jgi:NAD(P)-dependent dehydrogenase (short-subunit alcohol dehydrogenase family)